MSGSCWGAESDPKEFPVKLCCKNEEEVEERAGSANAIAVANSQTPTIFYSSSCALSYLFSTMLNNASFLPNTTSYIV